MVFWLTRSCLALLVLLPLTSLLTRFACFLFPVLVHPLVTTDIKDVMYVINFDFPNNVEDYIHRIGRTGRAGAKGTAYTFFTPDKAKHARELARVITEARQQVPSELSSLSGGFSGGGGGGSRYGGGGRFGGGGGGYGGRGRY